MSFEMTCAVGQGGAAAIAAVRSIVGIGTTHLRVVRHVAEQVNV